jgi:hypothetical protein
MKTKKIDNFINERKMDDYNGVHKKIEEIYDPDRKWFLVNIEEGEILSTWDYLEDAFIDGLMDELIVQGILENDKTEDFKDNVDVILSEFGYYDIEDDEDVDTYDLEDLVKNKLGVKNYVIRHRSEL